MKQLQDKKKENIFMKLIRFFIIISIPSIIFWYMMRETKVLQ